MQEHRFLYIACKTPNTEPGEIIYSPKNVWLAEPIYEGGNCSIQGQSDIPFDMFWNLDVIIHSLTAERPSHIPQTKEEAMANLKRMYADLPAFIESLQGSCREIEISPSQAVLALTTNTPMANHLINYFGFGVITVGGQPKIYNNEQGEERQMIAVTLENFVRHAENSIATAKQRGIIN